MREPQLAEQQQCSPAFLLSIKLYNGEYKKHNIMKCPYCGYDKVQPNFNFCPSCKKPLNENANTMKTPHASQSNQDLHEKNAFTRLFDGWTYEKAIADPYSYAIWAYKNPNDNKYYLNTWMNNGYDITIIRNAIVEANRARQENPTVDMVDVESSIINSNRQGSRQSSNDAFVEAVNAAPTTNAAAIVRNKAIWKLQPGELARHIAPDEWVYVSEHLEGLVIEEGTTAIIYIDGQEVAQMGSGMYIFDNKHAAAAEMEAERRKRQQTGFFSRLADGIYRFFTGHKREESTQQREERRRRVQQIMGRLRKDTMIDVYLKSDRIFPAIFGQQHLSETPNGYQPYIIQSRYLDLKVGVSMQLQIGDFKEFIDNYMAAVKTVSIADIVKSADSSVYSILHFRLRDIEIKERGLDEQTFNAIKEHLKRNLPNILHGIIVVDVLDITTSNEQLARFRQVEEQLYCSEREYDFLLRTNEFRNRIASEENNQMIREARSEQELRVHLDEVNKDNLLHADEMEQFVNLLMNQKVIREATNKAELDKAMLEIQRNRLIAEDEFEVFYNDLENRRFERDQVSEQMRVRSLMITALHKLDANKTLTLAEMQATDEISEAEWEAIRKEKGREAESWDLEAKIYGRKYMLEKQQLEDEVEKRRRQNEAAAETIKGKQQEGNYERGEMLKEHELEEIFKEDEYQRELRKQEDALKKLERLIEIEQDTKDRDALRDLERQRTEAELALNHLKEQHTYELEQTKLKEETERARIEAESKMSADQLLGKNIAQMSAAAQVAFAESFSNLSEIELTKMNAAEQAKLYQQMIEMAKANSIDMKSVYAANAEQQTALMREMISAFKEVNISSVGGQQNTVNSMLGVVQNFANTRINDAKDIKEEYRSQMHHEQERVDKNQEQSLNYTTRVKVSENIPNVVAGTSVNIHVGNRTCPICGEQINDKDSLCCPICGQDLK